MGLSEQEQKVLDELERQLNGNKETKPKPRQASETPTKYARLLVLGSVLIIAGLSLMLFATSLHLIWFGVVAFLTMLSGLYLVSQNWSTRAIKVANTASKKAKSTQKGSGSFFQDRWDQRNDGR